MSTAKRWKLLQAPHQETAALTRVLRIHPAICGILVNRGIRNYDEAKAFFRPTLDGLHDPFLMKDMHKAVDRITLALAKKEKILVFGDYDVDGTASVACMYQFLKKRHFDTEFYIPHRYREGYGVSKAGIDYAYQNNYTLIISLDCGIKSVQLIHYAKGLGIDFIVCDHHLPDTEVPPAVAILNPKQKGCNYPFKELCGCGVGFKLISALCHRLGLPHDDAHQYLDLVATAIAADIVSMTGENRIITYYGLKKANSSPNFGIKALSFLSGYTKELTVNNLVFLIAPRINAAGRMDDARKAVLMFVSESYQEALHYAEQLHSDNFDRKEADSNITGEALTLLNQDSQLASKKSTVLYQPHWHKGVVGIVASRLMEHFYRPTIILTQSGEFAAGSARSVSGFNVYEAIHQCRELLLGYGGHFYAAGMTLETANVEAFTAKFEQVVEASIHPDLLIPELVADAELHFPEIRRPLYDIICQMEPFGPDNLCPVFIARNVENTPWTKIVKEAHIRFVLKQDNVTFSGIGFNMAAKMPLLVTGQALDIVFKIELNQWNGEANLQLKILDFKLAGL